MRLPYELTKRPFADFDILYEISHQVSSLLLLLPADRLEY